MSHISYNDETWHSYTLSKEDPKNVKHPLSSAGISIFSPEISNFCYIKKYRYRLYFNSQFLILLSFFESSKVVSINTVVTLMMSAQAFWNKGYDVIVFVNDVTNKILSRDSNYTADVVMWPKFGYYSNFYERSYLKTDTRYGLEFLHQCGKSIKTESQKVLGTNSYVCRSYRGKTGRRGGGELFAPHPE